LALAFPPFKAPEFAYAMLVPGTYWGLHSAAPETFAGTIFAAQAVAGRSFSAAASRNVGRLFCSTVVGV